MTTPDILHPFHSYTNSNKLFVPNKPRRQRWSCPLPMLRIDEFDIIPLTSTRLLKSEGYHMNNCCRDYAAQCANGTYCMFSIRNHSGDRLATLGAKKVDDHYHLDQCFGPSNTNVIDLFIEHTDNSNTPHIEWQRTELFYAASEVIRALNMTKNN